MAFGGRDSVGIVIHNDDKTPMDFEVHLLETCAGMTERDAVDLMLLVHERAVGLAGRYPPEQAEAIFADM